MGTGQDGRIILGGTLVGTLVTECYAATLTYLICVAVEWLSGADDPSYTRIACVALPTQSMYLGMPLHATHADVDGGLVEELTS